MRGFLKNSKGAVTVFVTLLLIPAILVSGTAVDLARIHTARSIIQDANQLAANSVLTQYNALLHDLYGLFGVAEDDPILGQLFDEYIKVSIFGESGQDRSLGTLQLFYGSNLSFEEPVFPDEMNLRNEDILRRQIEEYMKFRGPVIIVQDILELLGSSTFKEDSGIINDKMEIESAIADIYEKYKELYNAIIIANKCDQISGGIVGGTVGTVSSSLDLIRQQFISLKSVYEAWETAASTSVKNDHAARYSAILENIKSRTGGGTVGSNWSGGRWQNTTSPQGLNKTIENAKDHADNFKPKFDDVINIAHQIDGMQNELNRKIDELENKLNTGAINDDLKAALTERTGTPAKSIIERYRDILKWDDLEGMANIFKDGGNNYIDNIMKPLLDDVRYRNMHNTSSVSLTRTQLESLQTDARFNLSSSVLAKNSIAATLADYTKANVTYNVPAGFMKFGDHPGRNKDFFEELDQMMNQPNIPPIKLYDEQNEGGGANVEAKQRNMINELMNLVNTAYAGLKNEPLGAMYINNSFDPGDDMMNSNSFADLISQAPGNPVAGVISDPLGSALKAADYLLLLSYCTSAFSNYVTARPDSNGKSRGDTGGINFPKSITGVPLSPEVNYFFQSEWEYLYNGNDNAGKNLSAVSKLIFIVRLICNYISVFTVNEVSMIVTSIRTAFIWNPPLGLLLGELARAAFVAAESAIDVSILRGGYKMPLIKSGRSGEWICSPSGIAKALGDLAAGVVTDSVGSKEKGLSYSNYLTFFFIAKGITESGFETDLTGRVADLIELNVMNYEKGIFSDEGQMSGIKSSGTGFDLKDLKTDFSLTTTVDMRMLFLSMIFAQNFSASRGIGIPSTMPVTVTDYRGY